LGDGVTTTLKFTGFDVAGNASSVITRTVYVDSAPPVLGPTTLNTTVFSGPTPALFAHGTATDGGGLSGASLLVLRPDGTTVLAPGAVSGANWSVDFVFDQVGDYQAFVIATDRAGNQSFQLVAGVVTAIAGATAPQSPVVTITGAGGTTTITWPHVTLDQSGNPVTVTAYRIYRSDNGAFTPPVLWQTLTGPFGGTLSAQDASPYTPGLSAYKVIPVVDVSSVSVTGPTSNPVGGFRYTLEPGD
jgi:hypothetical protein